MTDARVGEHRKLPVTRVDASSSSSSRDPRAHGDASGRVDHARQSDDGLLRRHWTSARARRERESRASTSRSLLHNTIGSGALATSSAFARSGIGLGVVSAAAAWYLATLTLHALLYCAASRDVWSYEELVSGVLGEGGRRVTRISVGLLQFGVVVAYVNVVGDTFFVAASSGILPAGTEPTRERVLWAVTFGVFLPLAVFVKSPERLTRMVNFGYFATAMFGFTLVVLALRRFDDQPTPTPTPTPTPIPTPTPTVTMWNLDGLWVVFPIMIFNFAAHVMVFPVLQTKQGIKSPSQIVAAADDTMLSLLMFYVVTGVSGYIAFGSNVNGNILRNFGSIGGWLGVWARLVKFLYGISLCSSVPMIFKSMRASTPRLMRYISMVTGQYYEIAFDVIVLYACARLATSIPNIQHVIGLVGSTTCSMLMFILPGTVFLKTYPPSSGHHSVPRSPVSTTRSMHEFTLLARLGQGVRASARGMIIFGIVFAWICTKSTLQSLREEAEVVAIIQRFLSAQSALRSRVQVYDRILTAATKFRRIALAEKTVSALSISAKSTKSSVMDAELSVTRAHDQSRNVDSMLDSELPDPFLKNQDDELLEAKEKLTVADGTLKNLSETLREVRETLKDIDVEPTSKAKDGSAKKDVDTRDAVSETYEHAREADKYLEEAQRTTERFTEDVDDDTHMMNSLSSVSDEVEETTSRVDETLETLRQAKATKAEEVLQAAVEVVEETNNADNLIESLRDRSVDSSQETNEYLVEKIVNVSDSVAEKEAQRMVDAVMQSSSESDEAVRKAGEILSAFSSAATSSDETVLKKFVNATMNGTRG